MKEATPAWPAPPSCFAGSEWFDPLEAAVRGRVRAFIEDLLEEELEAALGRERYQRGAVSNGRRHGHRPRQLVTTFGPLTLSVPRARRHDEAGEQEWKSALLPAYRRLSHRAEALIAEAYLAGMNTRRVRRALAKLFEGAWVYFAHLQIPTQAGHLFRADVGHRSDVMPASVPR